MFAYLVTPPCPYPVGDQSRHENHLSVDPLRCVYQVPIAEVGGKFIFLSGGPRDLFGIVFFTVVFFAFRLDLLLSFLRLQRFWEFERGFAHGGELPLSFLVVDGLGQGVETYCWPVTVDTVL